MTSDLPAEPPRPMPVSPAPGEPPVRLARLRREFADLYPGLDAGAG
jgi:hypothetical protein